MFWGYLASLVNHMHMRPNQRHLKFLSIRLSSEYFTLNSDCLPYSSSMSLHRRVQLSLHTHIHGFYMQSSFGHLANSLPTMATISAAGLTLRQHVIPLVSLYNDQADNTQVFLTEFQPKRALSSSNPN